MVNKKLKQIFPCPKCGSPTRNTKTRGDITLKKCDTCGECTKVLMSEDHSQVIKIFAKGERAKSTSGIMSHLAECTKEEKGTIIKLNVNHMTYDEQLKVLENFMRKVKGE